MTTFLYTVLSGPNDNVLELEPCPAGAITDVMWAELAAQMACEPGLLAYPAATLARRAEQGYAAVAVWDGYIVSHVALVPLGCRAGPPRAPHTWTGFCAAAGPNAAAGLSGARLPSIDVYDCSGSWTAPAWRGKGVSMALHLPLIEHHLADHSLGISATAGTTSRRLGQLGWQILGWSATPFVSSLAGIPLADFAQQAAAAWQPPAGLPRYEGPPLNPADPSHPWSQFCYFWVSDPALARQLDDQLAELCQRDLYCWQQAALEVFSQPGALHRLALLT